MFGKQKQKAATIDDDYDDDDDDDDVDDDVVDDDDNDDDDDDDDCANATCPIQRKCKSSTQTTSLPYIAPSLRLGSVRLRSCSFRSISETRVSNYGNTY